MEQHIIAQELGNYTLVSKNFELTTYPSSAEIYAIANEGSMKLGTGYVELELEKDTKYVIEVRYPGYQPMRKTYTRGRGGADEDTIKLTTRLISVNVEPKDAELIINNQNLGPGQQFIKLRRGETVRVEAKMKGFLPKVKIIKNLFDDDQIDTSYTLSLEDRLVSLTCMPGDASIIIDEKLVEYGAYQFVLHRNECHDVIVKKEGYVPVQKKYCNKQDVALPENDLLKLSDRIVNLTVTPATGSILVAGKVVGVGEAQVTIKEAECTDITIKNEGYLPLDDKLCNYSTQSELNKSYKYTIVKDDFIDVTDSAFVNENIILDHNLAISEQDAWKKLAALIHNVFADVVVLDSNTNYLRTDWAISPPFNIGNGEETIIRTRVILFQSSFKPAKYTLKIESEKSKRGSDCRSHGMKYPSISRDDCFEPISRISKQYVDFNNQIRTVLQQ